MSVLAVRNEAQRVLVEEELKGQISDGMWENARPSDHWQQWSRAEVVVDPSNVGRDFWAMKDNYRLDHPNLIEWIGDRMIALVIRYTNQPYDEAALRKDLKDLKVIFKTTRRTYATRNVDLLEKF